MPYGRRSSSKASGSYRRTSSVSSHRRRSFARRPRKRNSSGRSVSAKPLTIRFELVHKADAAALGPAPGTPPASVIAAKSGKAKL